MLVTPDPNTLLHDLDIVVTDAGTLVIEGGSAAADPSVVTTTTDATGPVNSVTITITVTPSVTKPTPD